MFWSIKQINQLLNIYNTTCTGPIKLTVIPGVRQRNDADCGPITLLLTKWMMDSADGIAKPVRTETGSALRWWMLRYMRTILIGAEASV